MSNQGHPRTPPRAGGDLAQYYRQLRTSLADVDDIAEWEGTPWLTGLANFCAVAGTMIGVLALIGLIGYAHRGFAVYWPMALILALDLAINGAVQLLRFKRRRGAGLTRAERRRLVLEREAQKRAR